MQFHETMIEALEKMEASPWASDESIVAVNLAHAMTIMVLGSRWFDRVGKLGSRPDPWMMNASSEWLAAHPINPDVRSLIYRHRMIRLGDALGTLFMGGNAIGSYVLVERLLSRQDTRSSFLETEIAAMLTKNGAKVDGVKESGAKGEDFDLLVTHRDVEISVEVTASTAEIPTDSIITNKLKEKSKQVPPDKPAVLYWHVPASWMRKPYGQPVLGPPIRRFMMGSHRFNIIVLVWEDVVPSLQDNGGFPEMTMQPIYSHVARHQLPDVLLFTPMRDKDGVLRPTSRLTDLVKVWRTKFGSTPKNLELVSPRSTP